MNQNSTPGESDHITVLADPDDISPFIGGSKKMVVLFEMTGYPF